MNAPLVKIYIGDAVFNAQDGMYSVLVYPSNTSTTVVTEELLETFRQSFGEEFEHLCLFGIEDDCQNILAGPMITFLEASILTTQTLKILNDTRKSVNTTSANVVNITQNTIPKDVLNLLDWFRTNVKWALNNCSNPAVFVEDLSENDDDFERIW